MGVHGQMSSDRGKKPDIQTPKLKHVAWTLIQRICDPFGIVQKRTLHIERYLSPSVRAAAEVPPF